MIQRKIYSFFLSFHRAFQRRANVVYLNNSIGRAFRFVSVSMAIVVVESGRRWKTNYQICERAKNNMVLIDLIRNRVKCNMNDLLAESSNGCGEGNRTPPVPSATDWRWMRKYRTALLSSFPTFHRLIRLFINSNNDVRNVLFFFLWQRTHRQSTICLLCGVKSLFSVKYSTELLKNHSTTKLTAPNVLMALTQFFSKNMNERIVLPPHPLFLVVSFRITLITNGRNYTQVKQIKTCLLTFFRIWATSCKNSKYFYVNHKCFARSVNAKLKCV